MDPKKALELARIYRNEGKYQEALEMHEYYHFNILSVSPAYQGARLSYAIADWLKLGEKYPKAKQRLIEIRDGEIKKVKSGNWSFDNFWDMVAISRYLKEDQKIIEVFKIISGKESDSKKINSCFNLVLEDLVNAGEMELCNKYFPDPVLSVQHEKERLKTLDILPFSQDEQETIEDAKIFIRKDYVKKLSLLVRVLKSANRLKDLDAIHKVGRGVISDEEYEMIFK